MWRCVCARDVSRAQPEGYNILRKGEKQAALKRWKIACQVPVVVDHKRACGRDWSLALEREHGSSAVLVHTSKLYALPPQISL